METIVFTYGRMNPPHVGHLSLITSMIETALANGSRHVVILLSSSIDAEKNPLECNEKRTILLSGMIDTAKSKIPGSETVNVHVFCPEDLGTSNKLQELIRAFLVQLFSKDRSPKRLIMMIGEDRSGQFNWIQKSLTPNEIIFSVLPRPEGAMSATEIRRLATSKDITNFMGSMAPTGVPEEKLIELFEKLGDRIKPSLKKTSKSSTKPATKTLKSKTGKKKASDLEEEVIVLEEEEAPKKRRTGTKGGRRIKHKHSNKRKKSYRK